MKIMDHPDKRMSRRGLIKFYQDLVNQGRLLVGSAGHKRMVELQQRQQAQEKFKRYYGTAERPNFRTT